MVMMMFSGSSSRIAIRRLAARSSPSCGGARAAASSLSSSTRTVSVHEHASANHRHQHLAAVAAVATAAAVFSTSSLTGQDNKNRHKTYNAARKPTVPIGGELIQTAPPVKEPKTGILFPVLCNGYSLAGVGVRIKWGLIQVYAVGAYFDALAMSAIKQAKNPNTIEEALLDPTYPRTIRIVMARGLSMQKFTDSIAEALEPRMHGQDLDKYVVVGRCCCCCCFFAAVCSVSVFIQLYFHLRLYIFFFFSLQITGIQKSQSTH
jgi:predicted small secreted protein